MVTKLSFIRTKLFLNWSHWQLCSGWFHPSRTHCISSEYRQQGTLQTNL